MNFLQLISTRCAPASSAVTDSTNETDDREYADDDGLISDEDPPMDEGVGENSEGSGEEEGSGGDEESGAEVRRRRKRQSSATEIGSEQEFRMEPSSLMTVLDTPLCLEEGKRYEIKLIFDQVWPLTLFLLFHF